MRDMQINSLTWLFKGCNWFGCLRRILIYGILWYTSKTTKQLRANHSIQDAGGIIGATALWVPSIFRGRSLKFGMPSVSVHCWRTHPGKTSHHWSIWKCNKLPIINQPALGEMSERCMIRMIMIVWYCISINSGLVELVELLTVVPYYTATYYYASILVGVVQVWTIARTIVWYPFWMACLRWYLTSALARLTTTTVALLRTPECRFMASKCQVVFS